MKNKNQMETPEATLSYIKTFLDKSRLVFRENGFHYLYWGIAVPVWTGLTYLLGHLGLYRLIGWSWMLLYAVSLVIINIRERRRDRKIRTFAGSIMGYLWIGMLATAAIIILMMLISGNISLKPSLAVLAAMLGMAFFVTGALMENKKVSLLGGGWWLVCLIMGLIPEFWAPAFMALATILLDFIPGLIFYRNSRASREG